MSKHSDHLDSIGKAGDNLLVRGGVYALAGAIKVVMLPLKVLDAASRAAAWPARKLMRWLRW